MLASLGTRRQVVLFVGLAFSAYFLLDVIAPFTMFYNDRHELWQQHKAFSRDQRNLAVEYPRVILPVMEKSIEFTNHGVWMPALRNMWHTALVFDVPRQAYNRFFGSILMRMLTPQSVWEYVALTVSGIIIFACLAIAVYFYINSLHTQMLIKSVMSVSGLGGGKKNKEETRVASKRRQSQRESDRSAANKLARSLDHEPEDCLSD